MILHISRIAWECDGQHPNDVGLPENVLVINVPADIDWHGVEYQDILASELSGKFGWLHNGFLCERFTFDPMPMDKVCLILDPVYS